MKIKKLMTLTMAVALSIGILGGCGTKASAGQSFTILEGQFSEISILGKMVGILNVARCITLFFWKIFLI